MARLPAQVALTVEDAPKEALLEARAQLARAKAEEAAEAAAGGGGRGENAKARKTGRTPESLPASLGLRRLTTGHSWPVFHVERGTPVSFRGSCPVAIYCLI